MVWPGKPQFYFTLVTADNLPAKRSKLRKQVRKINEPHLPEYKR